MEEVFQLGQELGLPPSLLEAMQAVKHKFGSAAAAKICGLGAGAHCGSEDGWSQLLRLRKAVEKPHDKP